MEVEISAPSFHFSIFSGEFSLGKKDVGNAHRETAKPPNTMCGALR